MTGQPKGRRLEGLRVRKAHWYLWIKACMNHLVKTNACMIMKDDYKDSTRSDWGFTSWVSRRMGSTSESESDPESDSESVSLP